MTAQMVPAQVYKGGKLCREYKVPSAQSHFAEKPPKMPAVPIRQESQNLNASAHGVRTGTNGSARHGQHTFHGGRWIKVS